MKLKHGIILLALGFCLDFIGTWMKITHQLFANEILGFGILLKVGAIIIIVIKLVSNPKLKDFMDR